MHALRVSGSRRALGRIAAHLLLLSASSTAARTQQLAPTTERAELGAVVALGGEHLADGYAGIQLWSPLIRSGQFRLAVTGAYLRSVANKNRHLVTVGGAPDTSYVMSIQRLGAEARWHTTAEMSVIARAGVAHGNWAELPGTESTRRAVLTPFWSLGTSRGGRAWSVEANFVVWRHVSTSPSTWSLEAALRRRL